MSTQLSQEIEYKNPCVWFKDMWFQNVAAALASAVKHKTRLFYIEDLPEDADYTTHFHTYSLTDGVITGVLPLANEILELLKTNALDHISSVTFEDGVLTLARGSGNTLTASIDTIDSPIELKDQTWDASTNTPDISGATTGEAYVVAVGGTYAGIDFLPPDWIVKTVTGWMKIDKQTVAAAWSGISGKPFDSYDVDMFYVEGGVLKIKTSVLLDQIEVPAGEAGASALELWNNEGHEGDINDFLDWLSASSKLTETIIATGVEDTMGIPDGEEFTAGSLMTAVFKQILRRAEHPDYTMPEVVLTVGAYTSSNNTVEVGTTISALLSAVFTAYDAVVLVGDVFVSTLKTLSYICDDSVLVTGSTGSTTYTHSKTLNVAGEAQYQVLATFDDYYTKKNNLGEDDATNKFSDRSVSDYFEVLFKYKHFAVALAEEPDSWTDSLIRSNNIVSKWAGSNYSFCLDGKKSFAIVVPPGYTLDTANTKTDGSIPDALFSGVEFSTFQSFACAGSATAEYKLYTKTNAVAYNEGAGLNLNVILIAD